MTWPFLGDESCLLPAHAQRALTDPLGSVDRAPQFPVQPSSWLSSLGVWGDGGESEKTAWGRGEVVQKPNPVAKWICETGGLGFQSLGGPWGSSGLIPLTTFTPRALPKATQPFSGRVRTRLSLLLPLQVFQGFCVSLP